jgi:hypothetical protein
MACASFERPLHDHPVIFRGHPKRAACNARRTPQPLANELLLLVQARERLLGVRVAGVGSLLVPLAGFAAIFGNAQAVLVNTGQIVHGTKITSAHRRLFDTI